MTSFVHDSVALPSAPCPLLCCSPGRRQVVHCLEMVEVVELVFPLNVDLHAITSCSAMILRMVESASPVCSLMER